MTTTQLLELLIREFEDKKLSSFDGKSLSNLGALELIEQFKKQIQDETINDFLTEYKMFVPDHDARKIAADRISRYYAHSKNPLVKCR